jgi:hypothetical protein
MDPRKREFWLGGTVDDADKGRLARADSLDQSAALNRDSYFACARSYGVAHASSKTGPADIADAAAASCVAFLDSTIVKRREAVELRIVASRRSDLGAARTRDVAEQDLANEIAGSRERARQETIRAVVDARP